MANDMRLSMFPTNEYEALALLYIQQQDLSKLSPEEIYDKYEEAKDEIRKYARTNRKPAKLNKISGGI